MTKKVILRLCAQKKLILDSVGEGILGLDVEGRCVFANPAALRLLKINSEQLIGTDSHMKFHHTRASGEPYPVDDCPIHGTFIKGQTHRGRDYFWCTDGCSFPIEFTSTPLEESGKVTGAVVVFRDITELKKAEDEIAALNRDLEARVAERTAELESANQGLEAFAYSVSHDLRAPLRAINGLSQILIEDHGSQLDAEGMRVLGMVRDSIDHMNQLIDDILKFSRVGRADLTNSEIDMERLFREVFAELRPLYLDGDPMLVIEPMPATQGDAAMIRQVVVNLLSNALKFSRTRERARIKVGGFVDDDEVVYFINDNGVGFDIEHAHKIFGVFQRLHSGRDFEGAGIGLAIVKRIVTRHGGRVWADSKLNQGATFYFSQPRCR
jgi:PAS domain S-box-containing protein